MTLAAHAEDDLDQKLRSPPRQQAPKFGRRSAAAQSDSEFSEAGAPDRPAEAPIPLHASRERLGTPLQYARRQTVAVPGFRRSFLAQIAHSEDEHEAAGAAEGEPERAGRRAAAAVAAEEPARGALEALAMEAGPRKPRRVLPWEEPRRLEEARRRAAEEASASGLQPPRRHGAESGESSDGRDEEAHAAAGGAAGRRGARGRARRGGRTRGS
eukprot:tig00001065_g6709.t1